MLAAFHLAIYRLLLAKRFKICCASTFLPHNKHLILFAAVLCRVLLAEIVAMKFCLIETLFLAGGAVLSKAERAINPLTGPNYVTVDRNLAMELVRVTEVSYLNVLPLRVIADSLTHLLGRTLLPSHPFQ